MSTLTKKQEDLSPLSLSDLEDYFLKFSTPREKFCVGLESEWFPLRKTNAKALPFSGNGGIEVILNSLSKQFNWDPICELGRTVALKRGKELISLEPGGQVEYATPPLKKLGDIEVYLKKIYDELNSMAQKYDVEWTSLGFQPYSRAKEIEWVPKARYSIMKDYLIKRGGMAHEMMLRTAATQVSFDYSDEQDAMKKMRLGFWVSPFISLLSANSPLKEGQAWSWISPRVLVWEDTDSARSGILKKFLSRGAVFRDYLNFALDTPMMFIVRGGEWLRLEKTFRKFLQEGYGDYYATLDDFELHLSALFPEVRLKQFIEMRQADAVPFQETMAIVAFWKGLLYSESALDEALKLFDGILVDEFLNFRLECAKKGFKSVLSGTQTTFYTDCLLRLAKQGLRDQDENVGCLSVLGVK